MGNSAAAALSEAIRALERAREAKLSELRAIEEAIAKLTGDGGGQPPGREYAGLGIVESARRYLREIGQPRSTRDIVDALLARGWASKSRNQIATVYATLANAKSVFERTPEGTWALREGPRNI